MDVTSTGKVGRYRVLRVLGRGGMGEVLLAEDEDLGRKVAIKRPFRSAMEDGLARFQVEAKAAILKHPNIPAVYEMGEQDGLPYIAMEFVEGDPLDKIIASGRPLELIAKLNIIRQVCLALGHAHEKGIVHRDIKPANVIVQPDGVAKIIDFGIAKLTNLDVTRGLTQTQQIIGSLHYIAPERFRGETIDGRADIFSAGVMLYLLLTGHLPFGGSEVTASYKIVNEAHSSLKEHIHDYPPALDGIMDKALAKDPYDRYSTAEDFAEALDEVIEELKKSRVGVLFDDAERLAAESRYAPALELLDEAIRLDPNNTQVKKLRKLLREHQDRQKRAERTREFSNQADAALAVGNYTEALTALREAQRLDSSSVELRNRLQAAEEQKRKYERSQSALAEVESVRARGDVNGALRLLDRALGEDAENARLLAARAVIVRQIENEAKQGEVLKLVEQARQEMAAQHVVSAQQKLREAEALDGSHPQVDALRRDLARIKEQEERRQLMEEIQRRVNEFLRADNYEGAADLLNRAIEKLPHEAMLQRLKVDVDTEARKFDAKRFVDNTLARARDLFAKSPQEALALLQKTIEEMPGEERLIAYERLLRQQADTLRAEQKHAEALRTAREQMEVRRFDRAVEILEGYQGEFGSQADVEHLLGVAREEAAQAQRRSAAERCLGEARALLQEERFEDAARLLEAGCQATNDASLARLLEETRQQQQAATRKREMLVRRVASLRERGELAEAVELLEAELASSPKNQTVRETLNALRGELEQKQATQRAIETARASAQQGDFAGGLLALQAVTQAYGESAEIAQEIERLTAARAAAAQEVVGRSIEAARAALLRSDYDAALLALKDSAEWVEFTDARLQADWQRIAKSAKEDLRKSGKSSSAADLLVPEAPVKSTGKTIALALVGCAVIAVGGFIAYRLLQSKTPVATMSHISVFRAQPGAVLTVEGYAPVTVAANGEASVEVKPGTYKFTVTKPGFDPYASDSVKVDPTNPDREPVTLTRSGTTGTLVVQGNTPARVKVFVDGSLKGTVSDGGRIKLEAGQHTVRFSAPPDYVDQEAPVTIALNQDAALHFELKPAPKPVQNESNLQVTTAPNAQISVDNGQKRGTADASGNAVFTGLTPGAHTVEASLDGYAPLPAQRVTLVANQNGQATLALQPLPPQVVYFNASATTINQDDRVTLSWQVNRAASVTIDPIGGSYPATGTAQDAPKSSVVYHLKVNGVEAGRPVTVTVNPKPVVQQQAKAEPPAENKKPEVQTPAGPPDAFTLRPVVNASKTVYEQASHSRNEAECKQILTAPYGGALRNLANRWCGSAKTFVVTERCDAPSGGTADAPTLACDETLVITAKTGEKLPPIPIHKTFLFSRNGDSWVVRGWQ
jgi:serine/threonine-protein kinase